MEKFNETAENKELLNENVKTEEIEIDTIGLRFAGLNNDTRKRYNIPKGVSGVVITAVKRNSFSQDAGLTVGSVISQISQRNIKKPSEAKKIFDEFLNKNTDSVLLQVFVNNFSSFLILKLK